METCTTTHGVETTQLPKQLQSLTLLVVPYPESRREHSASISSINITDGLPEFAWDEASEKASRKNFSLSPA